MNAKKLTRFLKANTKKTTKFLKEHEDIAFLVSTIGVNELAFLNQEYFTKAQYKFSRNTFSGWMDQTTGGGYHRLYHGHDLALNLIPFIKKFGIGKAHHFFKELGKDSLSPNGIPFPFVQGLERQTQIPDSILTQFGSFNVADVIGGGVSLLYTRSVYKRYKKGFTNKDKMIIPTSCLLLGYGYYTGSPFVLLSSALNLGLISHGFYKNGKKLNKKSIELDKDFKKLFSFMKKSEKELQSQELEAQSLEEEFKNTDQLVKEILGEERKLKVLQGGKK